MCLVLVWSSASILIAQAERIAGPIDLQRVVPLKGGINPNVRREDDQGIAGDSTRLEYITLLLGRTSQQREALRRLLAEQQDPASPNYHQWLTPEEFGERFGVSRGDLDRLAGWLRSNGFAVESTARGRSWIVFSGTAGQVKRTFRTEIHRYSVDGTLHFANAAPPSIPAAFEGLVAGIRGLDDFYPEPPLNFQPRYNTANFSHALAPADLGTIYNVAPLWNAGIDGTGQNIAIMGESAINPADIDSFRQMLVCRLRLRCRSWPVRSRRPTIMRWRRRILTWSGPARWRRTRRSLTSTPVMFSTPSLTQLTKTSHRRSASVLERARRIFRATMRAPSKILPAGQCPGNYLDRGLRRRRPRYLRREERLRHAWACSIVSRFPSRSDGRGRHVALRVWFAILGHSKVCQPTELRWKPSRT